MNRSLLPTAPSRRTVLSAAAAALGCAVLALPLHAGPDDLPTTHRVLRSDVSSDATAASATADVANGPEQPLRGREKSFRERGLYRALTLLEQSGAEFDTPQVGYLQTVGPAPMRSYRPPTPPHPRHFHASTALVDKPVASPSPAASPVPASLPDANPPGNPAPAAAPSPTPLSTSPDPATNTAVSSPDTDSSILPGSDVNGDAARSRTEELLSYFRRQAGGGRGGAPGVPPVPGPLDPAAAPFLQAPPQLDLPPSRATYRVTP